MARGGVSRGTTLERRRRFRRMGARVSIDLDRLEQLAAEATPPPWVAVERDGLVALAMARAPAARTPENSVADTRFIAACDPATVAALVRAVKEAVTLGDYLSTNDFPDVVWSGWAPLIAALAPFRTPVPEDGGTPSADSPSPSPCSPRS